MEGTLGIWMATSLTFMLWTMLYRENWFSRLAEHLVLGVAIGYVMVVSIKTFLSVGWDPLVEGHDYLSLISIALGLLMLSRYHSKTRWLNRWPIAVLVGTGVALAMRGMMDSQIIRQILATTIPLTMVRPFETFNSVLILIAVLTTLAYFFFTMEQKGAWGITSKIGRYSMMLMFGATFGGTIMTNMTYLIGVLKFLFSDWLGP